MISKEQFNALPSEAQPLYIENDGEYKLVPIKTDKDIEGIVANRDKILAEKKALDEKLTETNKTLSEFQDKDLENNKNFQDLSEKYKKNSLEAEQKLNDFKANLKAKTIETETIKYANEIYGKNGDLLSHTLQKYINYDEETQSVALLDGDSAITIEQLKDRIKADARLKDFVYSSSSTGGGANGSKNLIPTSKKFSDMDSTEKNELYQRDKQEYKRIKEMEK